MQWMHNMLARIQHRAETKGAKSTLFILAFIEAIFLPVPPDLLLIPLALASRKNAFKFAAICTAGSVLGGAAAYLLGYFFMDIIGMRIIHFYGMESGYASMQTWYQQYDAWAVVASGLTPVPYKVATLAAGAFAISFPIFILASIGSRGLRFFVEATLIHLFEEKIHSFLLKRFNFLLLFALIVVVLGFVIIKYLI